MLVNLCIGVHKFCMLIKILQIKIVNLIFSLLININQDILGSSSNLLTHDFSLYIQI